MGSFYCTRSAASRCSRRCPCSCAAARRSRPRRCTPCKTRCAPPCRTREQFVPDTLENITAYVRKDLCIGAWQGSRLGGYLIVRFCGRSAHNYAAFMDVPRTEWEHWANADSAIVHARLSRQRPATAHAGSSAAAFRKKSPISVLLSARRTSTACTTPLCPVLPSSPGGKCTAATTATCWQRSCKKL
mgnify:CR=1 FL=1